MRIGWSLDEFLEYVNTFLAGLNIEASARVHIHYTLRNVLLQTFEFNKAEHESLIRNFKRLGLLCALGNVVCLINNKDGSRHVYLKVSPHSAIHQVVVRHENEICLFNSPILVIVETTVNFPSQIRQFFNV